MPEVLDEAVETFLRNNMTWGETVNLVSQYILVRPPPPYVPPTTAASSNETSVGDADAENLTFGGAEDTGAGDSTENSS